MEFCDGYLTLKAAVENDHKRSPGFHDYDKKLAWVIERAKHYADKTGLRAEDILDAWEKGRDYWYMNFYQDCNQPKIEGESVQVFDTMDDLKKSIGKDGFRCPACNGISKNPYTCDSGVIVRAGLGKRKNTGKPCDWKMYGLLGDLGKGVYVFVKSEMRGQRMFKPVAWESGVAIAKCNEKKKIQEL